MENFLNTTLRNISWFKNAFDRDELDLKPPFQRNPVWVTKQKSYLIDTILNGFPIPEIYMQETVNDTGSAKYLVVDGQQRTRAVLDFINGNFSIDGKDSPDYADMSFDDLSGDQKKEFFKYNFVIRLLPDVSDARLREIFQRLNKNTVALNKQELRQATYWGPFIKTMNSISDKDIWSEFDIFSPNAIRRMLDVEYISELAIAVLHGHQNKKQNLDKFYRIYEEEFEQKKFVSNTFDSVLKEIIKILPEFKTTRWKKRTDFYTLFLVLAQYVNFIPFSSDVREKLNKSLISFGQEVDYSVKVEKGADAPKKDISKEVKIYLKGIRSSTDLNSRKFRFEGLENALKPNMT